jgi:hypothetical protein
MSLTLTGEINDVLAGRLVPGSLRIEAWGLGVDCRTGLQVLNLYSQGANYPVILGPPGMGSVVAAPAAARGGGAEVLYWPATSVLFLGRVPA